MNVFISYSHEDSEWANTLAERLRSAGFGVWDPETELYPGDNFALKIAEALENADAMVALVSPDAMASEWVRREIDFALGASQFSGRLIPVVVRPTEGFPWILRKLKPISPEGGPSAAADSVVQALQRAA
ncbi:toll/interleukin-1 receptor domain-containing protein [Candidatus Thiosymbion oneisti]|uniref:toll/interleukin-1 receptor domain-containing protein n=1 Tax=Candidatus Thiosymbion oneisti TaxID=589554 RepID=UPI000B7FFC42|nr:toll/interleukin-1 receptor domain-containing protein [Candidatus Thiosymbion oneisti]